MSCDEWCTIMIQLSVFDSTPLNRLFHSDFDNESTAQATTPISRIVFVFNCYHPVPVQWTIATLAPTSKELGLALFNCYNQPNACVAPNTFTCPHSKLVLVVGKHQISRLWSPKRCSVIVSAIHHKFRSPNPYSSEESYNSIFLQQVDRTMFEWDW